MGAPRRDGCTVQAAGRTQLCTMHPRCERVGQAAQNRAKTGPVSGGRKCGDGERQWSDWVSAVEVEGADDAAMSLAQR